MSTRAAAKLAPDLSRGYRKPLRAQGLFHASPAKYRLYSGGYGSGKTACGSRESMRTSVQFPGSRNLVSRRERVTLRRTTQQTFFRELAKAGFDDKRWTRWRASEDELHWWNKSVTIFSGLDDFEKLKSFELSTAWVDEGSEVEDEIFETLFPGRLRWHLPSCPFSGDLAADVDPTAIDCPCPRRGWITTNPGASGYLRKHFVASPGSDPRFFWVSAPSIENPYNGADYADELVEKRKTYGDVWFKRFVMGSWDAFAGQVFTQWDPDIHTVEGFRPDRFHAVYEGFDFGIRNETAVVWIAVDESGEHPPVVFAEHQGSETEVKDHAVAIRAVRDFYGLDHGKIRSFGDPAGANRGPTLEGSSYFHLYAAEGIYIAPSMKDPKVRAMRIAQHLSHRDHQQKPGLLFDRRVSRTIQSLTAYRWREHHGRTGEDPLERFHKHDDHHVDALGYALVTLEAPAEKPKRKLIPGVASYALPREEREERAAVASHWGDEL